MVFATGGSFDEGTSTAGGTGGVSVATVTCGGSGSSTTGGSSVTGVGGGSNSAAIVSPLSAGTGGIRSCGTSGIGSWALYGGIGTRSSWGRMGVSGASGTTSVGSGGTSIDCRSLSASSWALAVMATPCVSLPAIMPPATQTTAPIVNQITWVFRVTSLLLLRIEKLRN